MLRSSLFLGIALLLVLGVVAEPASATCAFRNFAYGVSWDEVQFQWTMGVSPNCQPSTVTIERKRSDELAWEIIEEDAHSPYTDKPPNLPNTMYDYRFTLDCDNTSGSPTEPPCVPCQDVECFWGITWDAD